MSCSHARASSDACARCASQGVTPTSDGFERCRACGGAGVATRVERDACEHSRGNASRKTSSREDAMEIMRELAFVDAKERKTTLADVNDDVVAVYFASASCAACARFTPTLASYAKKVKMTVIVIACEGGRGEGRDAREWLPEGCGFLTVDYDGDDDGAAAAAAAERVTQALAITLLPTLVVINLRLNVVVTDWGRFVLSVNSNPSSAWRRGERGVPNPARALTNAVSRCAYGFLPR